MEFNVSENFIRNWDDLLWWRRSFEWEVYIVAKQVEKPALFYMIQ